MQLSRQRFQIPVVVADIDDAGILGMDFLTRVDATIDIVRNYNPGQNVWDKVPFSRIAAIFARSPLPPPPPPPMQCWTTRRQAFPYEQHCMGGGGGGGGGGR